MDLYVKATKVLGGHFTERTRLIITVLEKRVKHLKVGLICKHPHLGLREILTVLL